MYCVYLLKKLLIYNGTVPVLEIHQCRIYQCLRFVRFSVKCDTFIVDMAKHNSIKYKDFLNEFGVITHTHTKHKERMRTILIFPHMLLSEYEAGYSNRLRFEPDNINVYTRKR